MGSIPSVVTGEKMLQLIRKQIKLSQLSRYIRTKNHFNSWWSFAFGPKKNTILLLFYAEGLFYKVIFLAHSLSWAWPEGGRRGREGREKGRGEGEGKVGDFFTRPLILTSAWEFMRPVCLISNKSWPFYPPSPLQSGQAKNRVVRRVNISGVWPMGNKANCRTSSYWLE